MSQTSQSRLLAELKTEHRDLDAVIEFLTGAQYDDLMRIQRLKKRRLRLKDMISRLESEMIPDLDA